MEGIPYSVPWTDGPYWTVSAASEYSEGQGKKPYYPPPSSKVGKFSNGCSCWNQKGLGQLLYAPFRKWKGPHLTHAHYVSEATSNKQRQKFKRAMRGKENTHRLFHENIVIQSNEMMTYRPQCLSQWSFEVTVKLIFLDGATLHHLNPFVHSFLHS